MFSSARASLTWTIVALSVSAATSACGTEEETTPSSDAGTDAAGDATSDVATDSATDSATDATSPCTTPDPSETCLDTGCDAGLTCQPTNDQVCVPSSCICGDDGIWACTEDCGTPYACLPSGDCPAEPPFSQTCNSEGLSCSWGTECCCGDCFPSTQCSCEGGSWACLATDACMIPSCEGRACDTDDDCASFSSLGVCVDGVCQGDSPAARCASLDRDTCETISSVACEWVEPPGCMPPPDGVSLGAAGCFPAAQCENDADCGAGYVCEPQMYAAPRCYWEEPLCDACVEQRSLCVERGI